MSRLAAAALAAALAAGAPVAAHALHASASGSSAVRVGGGAALSLEASAGLVRGTATELAFYYPLGSRYKLSELTWDIDGVAMAGLQASVGFGRRVRLSAGLWSARTEGSGMMVDRDWLYSEAWTPYIEPSGTNWTHESRHPDTTVDKGTVFDVNLSVLAFEFGKLSVSGIVGYRADAWDWSSRGGTFVYSDHGFRDTSGDFEDLYGQDVLVIEYEQRFTVPYVGFGLAWESPTLRVDGHLLASGYVSATDRDHHVLRDVVFTGDFSEGTYLGLGGGATWLFAPRWHARLGLEYQSHSEITGDVVKSGVEGDATYANGAGIALEALMGSLGVGWRF